MTTPWAGLPTELVPALRPRLDAIVQDLVRQVSRAPGFDRVAQPKLARDVEDGVRVAVGRFVELVGTDQDALTEPVRQTFVALGAAEARDERTPEDLLGALRLASRLLLRAGVESLAQLRPVGSNEVLDLSDAVTAYVDELAAASTDGYALQVREQAGEGERRGRALGELLVRGGAPVEAVTAAARAAGWGPLAEVLPVLLPREHARDARFRFAADGVVLDRDQDALVLLRAGPRAGRDRLAELLRGRRAVVGPQLPWQQVPVAVQLAEATGRHTLPPYDGRPVFTEDHLSTLVLRGEPGALDVLTARWLAPFAGVGAQARAVLLATLESWLRHWGSRPDVAAELFVHPQTVSYRMRRLRALLGDRLDDPDVRTELLLVLKAAAPGPALGRQGRQPP